jgi:carbon storage regulator
LRQYQRGAADNGFDVGGLFKRAIMLVLTRRVGESFVIGDNIVVTVVRVAGGGVRIGIEAPEDCTIMRSELQAFLDSSQFVIADVGEED